MTHNENAYDVALGGVDLNLDTPPDDKTLVGRNAVISINLDDIHEFALNPRRADNPLFAEIKASIGALQEKLSERGEKIIAELEEQFAEERDESNKQAVQVEQVQSVRAVMDKLVHSMDETLKGLEPKRATV